MNEIINLDKIQSDVELKNLNGEIKMNANLNDLKILIEKYEANGNELNKICNELRNKEFELKTRKLELEFDPKFTDGLKMKEIAPKIHKETLDEQKEIIELKNKRDEMELEHKVLRLKIEFIKEVIDSEKQ